MSETKRDEALDIVERFRGGGSRPGSIGDLYNQQIAAEIRALVNEKLKDAADVVEGWHIRKGGYINLAAAVLCLRMEDPR